MSTKIEKNTYPNGSYPSDFECFGPPALRDGEFSGTMIADLGCFTQDGKDSNKYYAAHVCQHKKTKEWFAYFEWGRTGATKPSFMFIACSSKEEAQKEYEKQLHSKNDKRGEWTTIAGRRVLRAKAGEDCYLVRPLASRSTGLPDAKKITINEQPAAKTLTTSAAKTTSKCKWDAQTLQLMRDMNVGTVSYARSAVEGGNIPTQSAIDEGRDILTEARKRVANVGDNQKDQINDTQLKNLTYTLYSRISKRKIVGDENWILNQSNIAMWDQDLDAFESALLAVGAESDSDADPLSGFNIDMSWIDPESDRGRFIQNWMPSASRNRHSDMSGKIKIINLWALTQLDHVSSWRKRLKNITSEKFRASEKPLHQPNSRIDIPSEEQEFYDKANIGMLFHGTRSVNVPGILRENLRLPKTLVGVVITGAMFGPGIYWADDYKKSAGYTSGNSRWGGGNGSVRGRQAFMFIADVALGKPYVAPGPRGYTEPPSGHHCIFGKAGHSSVMNNEFITFDRSQHQLRYLAEFEI
jgi:hypothetical protein